MRILHISRTMGQGGAEKVVYQLCKGNGDVKQFIASCGGIYVDELKRIGVIHVQIPDIDGKSPIEIIRTLSILHKSIIKYDIDILHTHHRMAAFYARLLQIAKKELKHVYTAHNVFYGRKSVMRFSLSKAKIVACGETVKKNLIEEFSIPKKRICTIYNSIERTDIKYVNIPIVEELKRSKKYLIGCIGRLTEQKGFDIFVKAIAECSKSIPDIVGIIIGDGEDKKKIEDLANELGIRECIFFLGYQKDVLSIISRMEFIVLSSRWEGFPLTPIETFSVGKTIIVSDIDSNLEIVKPGVNGLSFETENCIDLSHRIMDLYSNKKLKEEFEINAYKDYSEKLSYERFLSMYFDVWDKASNS